MTTSTNVFNRISAENRGDCRSKLAVSTILFNASQELGSRLIINGIDYNDGLLALASTKAGSESVRNVGFTGHHESIKRMNKTIRPQDPLMTLHKVGELQEFGFRTRRIAPGLGEGDTIKIVTAGRSVFCPTLITADAIEHRPRLMWDTNFERITRQAYADGSPRCFAEDWEHQLRQLRGIYLLYLMQQNLQGRDTSARYANRLARKFNWDKEAGVFLYMSDLQKSKALSLA